MHAVLTIKKFSSHFYFMGINDETLDLKVMYFDQMEKLYEEGGIR